MPTTIYLGQEVRIETTFLDEDGNLIDPTDILVEVLGSNGQPTGDELTPQPESEGVWYVDWTPIHLGSYIIRFTGENPNDSSLVTEEHVSVIAFDAQTTLQEDMEFVFATELEPLYVDPDEILNHFPDASRVEAMERIYRLSKWASKYFKGEVPFIVEEYIRAAVLCEFSRIYDYSMGEGNRMTLGDLTVALDTSLGRPVLSSANASTWCEIAALLRQELIQTSGIGGMKATKRGRYYKNPVRGRDLKSPYSNSRR